MERMERRIRQSGASPIALALTAAVLATACLDHDPVAPRVATPSALIQPPGNPGRGWLQGVVRLNGAPLADVTVVAQGTAFGSSATGPAGEYRIRDLPAGDYAVGVIPPFGHQCGGATHLTVEAGGAIVLDFACSEVAGGWAIRYARTTQMLPTCYSYMFYGETIQQTTVFTPDGPELTATFNFLGIPDAYLPPRVTMTGAYDPGTGRFEASSSPIIVSLGIGYEPDPLVASWSVEFRPPSTEGSSASLRGVATLSSSKYGTCEYLITGEGPPF